MICNVQPVAVADFVKRTHYLLSDIAPLGAVLTIPPYSSKNSLLAFPRPFPPIPSLWKDVIMQDPSHGSFGPFRARIQRADTPQRFSSSPLDWVLNPHKGDTLTERVLARLIQSEAHEVNPHLRDDYRQSFITVTLAARGNTMPFVVASYQMYGLHPDRVWPAILARREAMLGPTGEASPVPQNPMSLSGSISPKKANQSAKKEDVA